MRECLGYQGETRHPTNRVRYGLLGLHAEGEQRRLRSNRLLASVLSYIDRAILRDDMRRLLGCVDPDDHNVVPINCHPAASKRRHGVNIAAQMISQPVLWLGSARHREADDFAVV